MSGIHGQVLGHLVRRGAEYLTTTPVAAGNKDASTHVMGVEAYQHEQTRYKVQPYEAAIVLLTVAVFMIVYASIRYTLGEVVSSLAMIEEPTTLVVAELRPVEDNNDPDSPLEKDRLIDEDITITKGKPITSSISGTIRHLAQIGGYTARWRGLVISTVYHLLQAFLAHTLGLVFNMLPVFTPYAFIFGSILSTVLLARIHMTWTHIMISPPSALPWYRRVPKGRTYFKALATPAFIFGIAQHLTMILPLMVYLSFGKPGFVNPESRPMTSDESNRELIRLLCTFATAVFVAIALLLPASVTLTRVEASLLPDDTETIVNFDRTLGGAAANLCGFGKINFRALYDAAWRSFDKRSRIRLIKFYVKYFAILIALWLIAAVVIAAEIVLLGGDRLRFLALNARS